MSPNSISRSATEKDLHIYLDCEGAFDEDKACHIIYQVLKAIEFLHSKQILHLDIKVSFLLARLVARIEANWFCICSPKTFYS